MRTMGFKGDEARTWAINRLRRIWPNPTMPGEYRAMRGEGIFVLARGTVSDAGNFGINISTE
jgi:hypothetical protein